MPGDEELPETQTESKSSVSPTGQDYCDKRNVGQVTSHDHYPGSARPGVDNPEQFPQLSG